MPTTIIHGVVFRALSARRPRIVRPIVGMNIRHVVSAIVVSKIMTVEVLGGVGFFSSLV
jgi:hypothetical protein